MRLEASALRPRPSLCSSSGRNAISHQHRSGTTAGRLPSSSVAARAEAAQPRDSAAGDGSPPPAGSRSRRSIFADIFPDLYGEGEGMQVSLYSHSSFSLFDLTSNTARTKERGRGIISRR